MPSRATLGNPWYGHQGFVQRFKGHMTREKTNHQQPQRSHAEPCGAMQTADSSHTAKVHQVVLSWTADTFPHSANALPRPDPTAEICGNCCDTRNAKWRSSHPLACSLSELPWRLQHRGPGERQTKLAWRPFLRFPPFFFQQVKCS